MSLPEYNEEYQIGFGKVHKTFIDSETNEEVNLVLKTSLSYGEETYKRIYHSFFASCFKFADSAKTKVLFYIFSSLKYKQYRFIGKPEEIAEKANVSRASVFDALKEMQRYDFVRKEQTGVWFINPALVSDLDELARQRLVRKYYALENDYLEG